MSESHLKQIRNQVRQVAKELFPEIMQQELYAMVEAKLRKEIMARLDKIDKRQADIQSFMVRQSAVPTKKAE